MPSLGYVLTSQNGPNELRAEIESQSAPSYYRARYYDPQTGRFVSEDPARSDLDFYTYVHNNPISGRDPLGLWDTYTHSALYWNALKACDVDDMTIWEIQKDSANLDSSTQAPWEAYMHAMKAPFQSPANAIQQSNDWILNNLNSAQRAYWAPGQSSQGWEYYFADAVHTITDATSPAHRQNGVPITWPSNPTKHGDLPGSIETWNNMTPAIMQQNVKAIQDAYEQVTGKKCGCQ